MEHHNKCLGIYMARNRACVVLIARESDTCEILNSFSVSAETSEEESFANLADSIAQKCREKEMVFSDVAVALDCTMFAQQNLHSEFNEPKQIAQTIKFDAEEALAVDAVEMATAFEIVNKEDNGSEVAVFAAGRALVSEIIVALQNNNLDPVTVEPDVICLRRFISQLAGDDAEQNWNWAAVSNRNCYLISAKQTKLKSAVRTFLTGSGQDKNALLLREITMTAAASGLERPGNLKVFDTSDTVNCAQLADTLAVDVQSQNLAALLKKTVSENSENEARTVDSLEMVIAAGAAIGQLAKTDKVDFRPDFMPYLGKKIVLEKTLKVVSISVTAILLALGLYLQMQMLTTNRYRSRLGAKLKDEYAIAMPGRHFPRAENPVSKLRREQSRIEDVKAGFLSAGGDDSVAAKLTFLLEALNNTPKDVDLDIGTITITTKNISVMGSTSSRGYLKLFSSIDKHSKLRRGQSTYESKNNRDNFRMTVELKQ